MFTDGTIQYWVTSLNSLPLPFLKTWQFCSPHKFTCGKKCGCCKFIDPKSKIKYLKRFYFFLHYTAPSTKIHCTALHLTQHYTILQHSTQYYIALHYTYHYTTLHITRLYSNDIVSWGQLGTGQSYYLAGEGSVHMLTQSMMERGIIDDRVMMMVPSYSWYVRK